MVFDNSYRKWEKSNWAFVAISFDENEVLRILSQKIISEEKKEIENLQKKICNSWDLIRKAQKYLYSWIPIVKKNMCLSSYNY